MDEQCAMETKNATDDQGSPENQTLTSSFYSLNPKDYPKKNKTYPDGAVSDSDLLCPDPSDCVSLTQDQKIKQFTFYLYDESNTNTIKKEIKIHAIVEPIIINGIEKLFRFVELVGNEISPAGLTQYQYDRKIEFLKKNFNSVLLISK